MALTVKRIPKLPPGRHHDGHGLYLQVTPTGGRSWVLRYAREGRERWLGLGPTHTFTLDQARANATEARQSIWKGIDPLEAKRAARTAQALEAARTVSFADATYKFFDQHEKKWTSAEHRQEFLSTLERFAFPVIGKLPVAEIDTGLVLKIIEPIWNDKNQTASRVRGRIESILDWSTVRGFRTGDNPARWKGHLSEVLPAKAQIAKVVHHPALAYTEMPAFIAQLANHQGIAPKALEFLILTAARTGEVVGARWPEFDLDAKIWTVPPERMKGRKEHRVPLSSRSVTILRALPREGELVFIGGRKGKPVAKMAMPNLIDAMGHAAITVHGFRSSFRDWAAESTAFPTEIIEASLAHTTGNATEQAYKRTDLLEKRRQLMKAWAAFCATSQRDATVTPIRSRGV